MTTFLALWGAFVSSALLGWNLYRDFIDRGRVRVTCFIGGMIKGNRASEKDYLVYRITNAGRRPVVITNVGGTIKDREFIISTKGLPKMLQPGQYLTEYTHDLSMLQRQDLKQLWALDSLGHVWKVDRPTLQRLLEYQ